MYWCDWNRKHFVVANLKIVLYWSVFNCAYHYKRYKYIPPANNDACLSCCLRYFAYITTNVIGISFMNDLHLFGLIWFSNWHDHLYAFTFSCRLLSNCRLAFSPLIVAGLSPKNEEEKINVFFPAYSLFFSSALSSSFSSTSIQYEIK